MKKVLFALSLDPGLAQMGWALWQMGAHPVEDLVQDAGIIKTQKDSTKNDVFASSDLMRRTIEITREIAARSCSLEDGRLSPAIVVLVIERFSALRNASTTGKMAHVYGAIAAIGHLMSIPIIEIDSKEVKRALTGKKGASKKEVEEAVLKQVVLDPVAKASIEDIAAGSRNHSYDAIAIGRAGLSMSNSITQLLRNLLKTEG